MNALSLQDADAGSPLEVVAPVLFNTFKHHARSLMSRVEAAAARGEAGLRELGARAAVVGQRLMDVYTGELTPRELSLWVIDELHAAGRLDAEAFASFLAADEYAVFAHPADGSQWVLRLGEGERFVHLHPARWTAHSMRVRANTLKTALVALTDARIYGVEEVSRARRDELRATLLGLPPLGDDPEAARALAEVMGAIRGRRGITPLPPAPAVAPAAPPA